MYALVDGPTITLGGPPNEIDNTFGLDGADAATVQAFGYWPVVEVYDPINPATETHGSPVLSFDGVVVTATYPAVPLPPPEIERRAALALLLLLVPANQDYLDDPGAHTLPEIRAQMLAVTEAVQKLIILVGGN